MKMIRMVQLLIPAALVLAGGCAQRVLVQPVVDTAVYNRLAVLPFETDSFFSTLGNQIADEVVVHLLKHTPPLSVIERTRLQEVLSEQNLSRDGRVSPESAIAAGKLLGVRALLTGSISVSIGNIAPTPLSTQRVATGTVTVRLIDTETGQILWGGREQSQYSTFIDLYDDAPPFSVKTDQEMIQQVITDLGKAVAEKFYVHEEIRY